LSVEIGAIRSSLSLLFSSISEIFLGLISKRFVFLVFGFVFLGSFLTEEVSISGGNTDEVRVEGQDDNSSQEFSEDVVLLLELEVARFGSSPAVVDVFLLVDPHEVDDGPGSNEGSRDHNKDATAGESASVGNVILSEPDDEEGSTSIGGQVEDNIDKWVPPFDLVIEHEEELLRDLEGNEYHSSDSNKGNTSLQRNDEAADLFFGVLIRAIANTAAALSVDLSSRLGPEVIEIIRGVHRVL